MFSGASNVADLVDFNFLVIFGIGGTVLVANTVFMLWCCVRYSRKRNPVPTNIEGSIPLEVTWTVIPTIIVMLFFWAGLGFNRMSEVPEDAMVVKVTGWQWSWAFEYENGKTNDSSVMSFVQNEKTELGEYEVPLMRLPIGRPVKLVMTSTDVLHSFYIPAMRIKYDVLPGGRLTYMWFVPKRTGTFQVFCAEYCGLAHSKMYAKIEVMPQDDFDAWYGDVPVKLSTDDLILAGKKVYEQNCSVCHTTDGSRRVGPSFKGKFGSTTVLATGKSLIVDDAYLLKSIKDPMADIVKGFPPAMAPIPLSDEKVSGVIAFIRTLK
jgi:cytochrome c oxidase subunit II